MTVLFAAALLAAAPPLHRCAAEAPATAERLVRFHYSNGEDPESIKAGADEQVRVLKPVRTLRGRGFLDVLEVTGYVYKAEYRVRLIYARGAGCALIGQEILEVSNSY